MLRPSEKYSAVTKKKECATRRERLIALKTVCYFTRDVAKKTDRNGRKDAKSGRTKRARRDAGIANAADSEPSPGDADVRDTEIRDDVRDTEMRDTDIGDPEATATEVRETESGDADVRSFDVTDTDDRDMEGRERAVRALPVGKAEVERQPSTEASPMETTTNSSTGDPGEYADRVQQAESVLREEEDRKRRVEEARRILEHHRQAQVASDPQLGPAQDVITRYAQIAAGVGGLLPTGLDLYGVAAVHLAMASKLAQVFNVPFSEHRGKALIAALTGSATSGMLAAPAASLVRMLPIVGNVAGAVGMGGTAFASTYALGKVLTAHFASGGNLLDFDQVKAKQMFNDAMSHGGQFATEAAARKT